jgi:hypothetical protein
MATANEIIGACRQARAVPANAANCNQFVIAVASRCGVELSGNADQIMREVTSPPWEQLGHDGVKASIAAANGAFVVGGMTAQALGDAHGHVVIVVKGPSRTGNIRPLIGEVRTPQFERTAGSAQRSTFRLTPTTETG